MDWLPSTAYDRDSAPFTGGVPSSHSPLAGDLSDFTRALELGDSGFPAQRLVVKGNLIFQ